MSFEHVLINKKTGNWINAMDVVSVNSLTVDDRDDFEMAIDHGCVPEGYDTLRKYFRDIARKYGQHVVEYTTED